MPEKHPYATYAQVQKLFGGVVSLKTSIERQLKLRKNSAITCEPSRAKHGTIVISFAPEVDLSLLPREIEATIKNKKYTVQIEVSTCRIPQLAEAKAKS